MGRRTRTSFAVLAVMVSTLSSAGCLSGPRDVTAEPRIRELGLAGRCLVLTTDVVLYQTGKPYRRFVLNREFSGPESDPPARALGTVRAGTHLRIVRVEHAIYYWDGFVAIEGDLSLARVEDGEFAGRVVDLGWSGIEQPAAGVSYPPYAPCPDAK